MKNSIIHVKISVFICMYVWELSWRLSGKSRFAMQKMQETQVLSLGWEDSPGGGHDNPLQYSCLENPMHRGAWQAMWVSCCC